MSIGNESAYPREHYSHSVGLTKRELFAAMVLQGFAANGNEQIAQWSPEKMVGYSLATADHFISELSKDPQP